MPALLVSVVPQGFRQDFVSDDMRRVHPDLPYNGTAQDRANHLKACDAAAYATIRDSFPGFKPPGAVADDVETGS